MRQNPLPYCPHPVSYTHLDVYKRQLQGENQSGELKSNVNFLRANTGLILRF